MIDQQPTSSPRRLMASGAAVRLTAPSPVARLLDLPRSRLPLLLWHAGRVARPGVGPLAIGLLRQLAGSVLPLPARLHADRCGPVSLPLQRFDLVGNMGALGSRPGQSRRGGHRRHALVLVVTLAHERTEQ